MRSAPTSPESPGASSGTAEPIRELLARFEAGDYLGALACADLVLDPAGIPVLTLPREDSSPQGLGTKAMLVLSLIDGKKNLEEVLDASDLPLLDALRVVCALVEEGHIFFLDLDPNGRGA